MAAVMPSMAIALQDAPARASAMSARSNKKQDLHAAGRRRLEQFKKNKREKATKQASEEQPSTFEALEPVDSNGDIYTAAFPPAAGQDQHSQIFPSVQTDFPSVLPPDQFEPPPAENSDPPSYATTFGNSNFHSTDLVHSIVDARHATIDQLPHPTTDPLPHSTIALPLEGEEDSRYKKTFSGDHLGKEKPGTNIAGSEQRPATLFQPSSNFAAAKQKPPRSHSSDSLFRPLRAAVPEVTNGDAAVKSTPVTRHHIDEPRYEAQRPLAPFANDETPLSSSRKDDFAALEQHIEDLTQEKFSLLRGLDKAKALVETLTQANSALTEDYNQQGAKVNELKDELARFQQEFRSQEAVLKNLKAERDRAVQESTSAIERSRGFAAEIVGLEEKILKTRSQELKSQKEVQSLRAEVESCRRQILSIEKDRLNAISLNDALQEEKKLLLSRIREAADKTYPIKSASTEDASTSTDDLVIEREPQASDSDQEPSVFAYPTSLPEDQLGIIESINALVTELGEEKEALLRLLRNESNAVTQLKVENAELMQKLESQTQQLELAVAQSMARSAPLVSPIASHQSNEELDYIDEGDEVVDRVLGWIMKLFPGSGSSRRGGSKHL
ncbi:hypothetical protein SELMODRAFT_440989 [Selaginella moellendorffii]|uniref:Uncharacterized protein n=1 Tax=Selaginella moellendorffii TaxID=88036 RepID=D8RFV6_SELML|nr:protein BLISTER [Selaginella moellendorffii]EFJ28930.1 hypothetical protein SELMODRAFT_440989 [Selaginella moellendorffii]|eukprot:XP_002969806.1 protein BLISTER [Selaginella moellendorffii]